MNRQQRAEDRVLDHRRQLSGDIAPPPERALDPLLVVLLHRRQALDGVGRQRAFGVDELMMLIAQQYAI
ncbi:MAG: hypothetical protein ACRDNT_15440 [Streptosporangiaceae bacterium]